MDDMRVAELRSRVAGAARLGEVRIADYTEVPQCCCILQNWQIWWVRAGLPSVFVYEEGFEEIESGFGTILSSSNYTNVNLAPGYLVFVSYNT